MNKKILFLAFASAAFFFGCTADATIGDIYCYSNNITTMPGREVCIIIDNNPMSIEICNSEGINGKVVYSCPTISSSSGTISSSSGTPSSSSDIPSSSSGN